MFHFKVQEHDGQTSTIHPWAIVHFTHYKSPPACAPGWLILWTAAYINMCVMLKIDKFKDYK